MKKFISLALVIAMILSICIVCTLTVSAARGDWSVYASRTDYVDEDNPENRSIAGYEYTEEGLHMIPGDYSDFTPSGMFQTSSPVDVSQGVYMKVRIDDFTYGGDAWFGFKVEQYQNDEFADGYTDNLGVSMLLRPDPETRKISTVQCNYLADYSDNLVSKSFGAAGADFVVDSNDRVILTYQITFNEEDGYKIIANGIELDDKIVEKMIELFEANDNMMYIGFQLYNSNKGGKAECTVLEFGTSPEKASKPVGDDYADPINKNKDIAELADASGVPLGEPAIILSGDPTSDIFRKITSPNSTCRVLADNKVNLRSNNSTVQIQADVKYETSYAVGDFPYAVMIVRNLCTCTYVDADHDGYLDEICSFGEKCKVYVKAGDNIKENPDYTVTVTAANMTAHVDKDNNSYLYFIFDLSTAGSDDAKLSGRIHGLRIDVQNIKSTDANRNNFDFCEIAFLRSEEEAEKYFASYMNNLGVETPDPETETETETESEIKSDTESESVNETETDTVNQTETVTVAETETETVTEKATESETVTEKTTEPTATEKEPNTNVDVNVNAGCGGAVSAGAIAIAAFTAIGIASFGKKED